MNKCKTQLDVSIKKNLKYTDNCGENNYFRARSYAVFAVVLNPSKPAILFF